MFGKTTNWVGRPKKHVNLRNVDGGVNKRMYEWAIFRALKTRKEFKKISNDNNNEEVI